MSAENIQTLRLPVEQLPLAARWLARFLEGLEAGQLTIGFDDGATVRVQGRHPGPHAHWRLHHPARLLQRVAVAGDVGFAEGYHEGDWSTPDLSALLHLGAINMQAMDEQLRPGWVRRLLHRLRHGRRANDRRGSRRNIAAHYDLGNDFYRLWLDPGMTYSSALFTGADVDLEAAQESKYARLLGLLDARPGQHILEIGCGWGGFAQHAARQGLEVTGITLSREQWLYAGQRLHEAGLDHRAQVSLTDYRDQVGQFDHIVSIEMFEAVGEKYWPDFFRTVYERLAPGGRAAIQVIVIDEPHYARYRREPDYIQLFIFPGGMLPTCSLFMQGAEAAGLRVLDLALFGAHYADTLAAWRERFESRAEAVGALGYDERFRRMWSYYLAYCEAGFRAGRIDLMQIALEKPA
ncbi:MAG: class I SAM-dependent methyltransferase [Pseudomonadota bacterium]